MTMVFVPDAYAILSAIECIQQQSPSVMIVSKSREYSCIIGTAIDDSSDARATNRMSDDDLDMFTQRIKHMQRT
jgi:hypothetical protein